MPDPFISICIPAYKRVDLLKKLLDSIAEQTYKNYELLISDDTPDDSVKLLVDNYLSLLPLSYEKNETPLGAGTNAVHVIRKAKGEWIKLMHGDDWFSSPDALQLFADAARTSGKDFIFSASTQIWLEEKKQQIDVLTPGRKAMLDKSVFSLFYLNVIGHPSVVMHRRDASVEYDTGFKWVIDIDFYSRYLIAHPGYHYIQENLVNIGIGPTQETRKYYKNIKVELVEYCSLLAKYDPALVLRDEYVFHLMWIMVRRYKLRDLQQIRDAGFTGQLPSRIEEIMRYQRRIPRIILKQTPWSKFFMERCFRKMTAKA
jgi:glycosyltransferase involved in cell wall biosynthesis